MTVVGSVRRRNHRCRRDRAQIAELAELGFQIYYTQT
jgi:hypothetical protein